MHNRDRSAYLAALKQAATPSSWTEIKKSVSFAKDTIVNDVIVDGIIKNLKAGMLIQESEGRYWVRDPMLRSFVLR